MRTGYRVDYFCDIRVILDLEAAQFGALEQEFHISCRIGRRPIREHVSAMYAPGVKPASPQLNNDGPLKAILVHKLIHRFLIVFSM